MDHLFSSHHGVVSRAQLLALDHSPDEIKKLVTVGSLRLLRRGWYANNAPDPKVERAVRAGGALSCVSALRLHGLWAPKGWPTNKLHVRRSRHFERHGRKASGVPNCRIPGDPAAAVTQSVDPLPVALAVALGCLAGSDAVALVDSALNKGLITDADLRELTATFPWQAGPLLDRTDAQAQSGTESLVRQRLRSKGIRLRSQVQIGDIGRVDFLVGERLIIEVDGWTYHSDRTAFAVDRTRDRRLVALGYLVIRLTYEQVLFCWHVVEPDLLAVIRARHHYWPRNRKG